MTVNTDFIGFKNKLNSIHDLAPTVPHAIAYNNAVKSSFNNRNANNMNMQASGNQAGYSAPTSNFAGSNMGDFLPFN